MALKIFGGDAPQKKASSSFSEDIVGRFRSGYQVENGKRKVPVALQEWRVTTGDPEVAEVIQALLGGEEPQKWDAAGEDDLEVFTKAPEVDVVLSSARDLRQKMVLWGRNGNAIYMSDGAEIFYPEERKGEEDPDAALPLAERKMKAREGTGAEPQVEVYFRLAADEDLGIFKFQSGSWSMVSDLAYHNVEEQIEEIIDEGGEGTRVAASLKLEEVSFVAKSGPRAGETVTYTKPVLTIKGAA